jgi:uncharacterized protein YjcR
MQALDSRLKDAILKEHKAGASPAVLAERHGVPLGTIKSWIYRDKVASKQKQDASQKANRMQPGTASQKPSQRPPGAPKGNKNAVGNRGGPGGPPGNKKAVSTHEHESIIFEILPEEDQNAWLRINTDKLAQLDTEIRICEIRERRMLQRIETLRNELHTMVKYVEEETTILGAGSEGDVDALPATVTKRTYEGALGQIQAIEDALTRVQARKARFIELQHKLTAGDSDDDGGVEEFLEALNGAGEVWDENS